ncbi:hypothetical protein EJ06DRAFT_417458 [Trichodelitschia bisporula]|uniref:Uncharacterized protein n=1 Tax=Trichodelitschia bisporula TaxID=703511 RepID=A0A6G1HYK9_9PEZI|nr:hypothetical protein EJ06DRAFT_417458 [Trichodelitschia bisporula]
MSTPKRSKFFALSSRNKPAAALKKSSPPTVPISTSQPPSTKAERILGLHAPNAGQQPPRLPRRADLHPNDAASEHSFEPSLEYSSLSHEDLLPPSFPSADLPPPRSAHSNRPIDARHRLDFSRLFPRSGSNSGRSAADPAPRSVAPSTYSTTPSFRAPSALSTTSSNTLTPGPRVLSTRRSTGSLRKESARRVRRDEFDNVKENVRRPPAGIQHWFEGLSEEECESSDPEAEAEPPSPGLTLDLDALDPGTESDTDPYAGTTRRSSGASSSQRRMLRASLTTTATSTTAASSVFSAPSLAPSSRPRTAPRRAAPDLAHTSILSTTSSSSSYSTPPSPELEPGIPVSESERRRQRSQRRKPQPKLMAVTPEEEALLGLMRRKRAAMARASPPFDVPPPAPPPSAALPPIPPTPPFPCATPPLPLRAPARGPPSLPMRSLSRPPPVLAEARRAEVRAKLHAPAPAAEEVLRADIRAKLNAPARESLAPRPESLVLPAEEMTGNAKFLLFPPAHVPGPASPCLSPSSMDFPLPPVLGQGLGIGLAPHAEEVEEEEVVRGRPAGSNGHSRRRSASSGCEGSGGVRLSRSGSEIAMGKRPRAETASSASVGDFVLLDPPPRTSSRRARAGSGAGWSTGRLVGGEASGSAAAEVGSSVPAGLAPVRCSVSEDVLAAWGSLGGWRGQEGTVYE